MGREKRVEWEKGRERVEKEEREREGEEGKEKGEREREHKLFLVKTK